MFMNTQFIAYTHNPSVHVQGLRLLLVVPGDPASPTGPVGPADPSSPRGPGVLGTRNSIGFSLGKGGGGG